MLKTVLQNIQNKIKLPSLIEVLLTDTFYLAIRFDANKIHYESMYHTTLPHEFNIGYPIVCLYDEK